MGYFEMAQICLNGHCITGSVNFSPELTSPFCEKCGQKTITECLHCNESIRGVYCEYDVPYVNYTVPSYCLSCGKPYPWTERILSAAKELIGEESIDDDTKAELIEVLPDIIADNPRTAVAVSRLQRFGKKAAVFTLNTAKELLVSFACEAAKRSLGW